MPAIDEISADVFRISVYVPEFDLQFNHFLVRDEQPLLFHAGMRAMFPPLREAVAELIDPARLRWIAFSHFEVDECGGLNDWLAAAPNAQAVCSVVGALVNLNDFAVRPPRGLPGDEVLSTGQKRFRLLATPHLPHGWDAALLFEETQRTLFCSDLCHHGGNVEPLTSADVVGRSRQALLEYQAGPLMDYLPYHTNTERLLSELAALRPRTLAIMHGSSYTGDGAGVLRNLAVVLKDVLAPG
ncbi:MAG TPA: MBL fold metallo-hydrolase [Phycisphaerae bacterium]|nr:MBL fold metallo-hydrolase [Phycisphaerae bacterium]HNU45344.1 MBL fold metallo-hydrolase [Phycisphaerae bacterium]